MHPSNVYPSELGSPYLRIISGIPGWCLLAIAGQSIVPAKHWLRVTLALDSTRGMEQ
jgi:hypothetical protein